MAGTASAVMSAQLSAGCDVPKDSQHRSFALLRRRSRVPNRLRRPSHLAAPTSREHGELVVVQGVLNPTTEHRDAAKAISIKDEVEVATYILRFKDIFAICSKDIGPRF